VVASILVVAKFVLAGGGAAIFLATASSALACMLDAVLVAETAETVAVAKVVGPEAHQLEGCRWADWACKQSHSAGESVCAEDVVAAPSSNLSFVLHSSTKAAIPCVAVVCCADVVAETCHFAWEAMLMLRDVEYEKMKQHAASGAESFVVGASILLSRPPLLHPHPRHHPPLSLENQQVLYAHEACRTITSQPVRLNPEPSYIRISCQSLANISRRKLIQLLVVTEDDDRDIDRA